MKYNLHFLVFFLGLLTTVMPTVIDARVAPEPSQVAQLEGSIAVALTATEAQEFRAFFQSKYSYSNARILADFWGQSLGEAKARIGRKILWGQKDVAILEQFLVDAKVKALQSLKEGSSPLPLFSELGYTYKDAEALSKFWGESVFDSKIRIEKNLVLGNESVVKRALGYARSSK
jgi:hypothetical protein